jgi:hypothetical protein
MTSQSIILGGKEYTFNSRTYVFADNGPILAPAAQLTNVQTVTQTVQVPKNSIFRVLRGSYAMFFNDDASLLVSLLGQGLFIADSLGQACVACAEAGPVSNPAGISVGGLSVATFDEIILPSDFLSLGGDGVNFGLVAKTDVNNTDAADHNIEILVGGIIEIWSSAPSGLTGKEALGYKP